MKHYTLLALLFVLASMPMQAQFYDYSFAPRTQQREQSQPTTNAKYKGGVKGLNKTLAKEFRPQKGKGDISGRIVVACVINEKGRIREANVTRQLDPALDAEAMRVVRRLKFKPAMQGKKKVSTRYNIVFPIRRGKVNFSTLETIDV